MSTIEAAEHTETSPVEPLLPVVGHDLQTPLLDHTWRRYVNLDYAASAPALRSVAERLSEVLPYYASVHRGAGYASQVSTSLYEGVRDQVRAFVGARDTDELIFTRNTTDSLNLLATAVPSHLDVLYLDIEHHANLLPWQGRAHRSLVAASSISATLEALETELAAGGIGLLAVTGASNVTGELLPLAELSQLAHRYGARLSVDAAQLAPHRRIDMSRDGIDYLAFSAHKLYAPYGVGVLVGATDWLDSAPAYLAGGGAVRNVKTDSVQWADSPARHEAGSPNVLGVAALGAAIEAIEGLDPELWLWHEQQLRDQLVQGLSAIEGVRVHQVFEDSVDEIGVVNFTIAGYDSGLAAAALSCEHGVGVRDGKFCAHPLLGRLGLPSGSLRASFGLGSSSECVDRLIEAVTALATEGLHYDYTVEDSRWVPVNDTREFPSWAPNRPGTAGAGACAPSAPSKA